MSPMRRQSALGKLPECTMFSQMSSMFLVALWRGGRGWSEGMDRLRVKRGSERQLSAAGSACAARPQRCGREEGRTAMYEPMAGGARCVERQREPSMRGQGETLDGHPVQSRMKTTACVHAVRARQDGTQPSSKRRRREEASVQSVSRPRAAPPRHLAPAPGQEHASPGRRTVEHPVGLCSRKRRRLARERRREVPRSERRQLAERIEHGVRRHRVHACELAGTVQGPTAKEVRE